MILIGEKLNSSIPKTLDAFNNKDEETIVELIKAQAENSAFLDINTAMCANETEMMKWVVKLVLDNSDSGIMLDSANPEVMEAVLPMIDGREIILNSLTLTQRFEEVSDLAVKYKCKIVALPIGDEGIPDTVEKRTENAKKLIESLKAKGIPEEDIFIDVITETLAVQDQSGKIMLGTIQNLREQYPELHLTCGLSNISFGLPLRRKINEAMIATAFACGLDSAICDTANEDLVLAAYIGNLMGGKDEFCMGFIMKVKNS